MKRKRTLLLLSILLVAAIISVYTTVVFATHSLCQDDTGEWYFSSAPPGSALPCSLGPAPDQILKSSNLFTNGTFQFFIGNAGPSVSVRGIAVTPAFSTVVTTETTTTCDGCSTQTFTMTSYPDTPCIGLVPLVAYSYQTERCTFSPKVTINAGQTYDFSMDFSDGQEISGSVTAQSN